MLSLLGRLYLFISGWSLAGTKPAGPKYVIIAAPHTSYWDFPYMMACAAALKVKLNWMGKHTLFQAPFGWFFRLVGGVPVDRGASHNVVQQMVDRFDRQEGMVLAIAPEGTRDAADHWKSGFYHIAVGAKVPILPGFLDFASKTGGLGDPIEMTGDIVADMEQIRGFYREMAGAKPGLQGPIRLKGEDEKAPKRVVYFPSRAGTVS